MSEDFEMLSARVPEELKQLVNADQRNNQEVVRAALWREFGGERKSDLERRLEEKENRIAMIQREKNERERELNREQQQAESLRSKLEAVSSFDKKQRQETFETLETVPWEPDNPAIQTNADDLDMTPEQLIEELEDYHAE